MQKIDAHQHYWRYHPITDAWITGEMAVIKRDFLPNDAAPLMSQNEVLGCVAVQADQSESETMFLLSLAEQQPMIKAVVGWVDLCADNIAERLHYFAGFPAIKGFRHIVQAEEEGFMLRDDFQRGIAELQRYNFTYDILIKNEQLTEARELVNNHPRQRFVLDHMAKPNIKHSQVQPWADEIASIAENANVSCKVSGFGTEADWQSWTYDDVKPYFDTVLETFRADRVIFGSDWPVSLLAGGYTKSVSCLDQYLTDKSDEDKAKFWHKNAINFYNLDQQ